MKPSPLELDDYKLTCLRIEQAGGERTLSAKRNEGRISLDDASLRASVDVGEPDAPANDAEAPHFAIRLRLFVEPDPSSAFPYRIEVGLEGFFAVHGSGDVADARALAAVNGTSVLYGVARELVLAQTMRFGDGAVMLPSVHFLDLKKVVEEKAVEESNTAASKAGSKRTNPAAKKLARSSTTRRARR
ncbi:MAG: hypothetical protein ING52_01955 [Burkholderiales bacterium]|jgi:preprotein translocase subunit SecB|nr:hypothetical protein [Burkholderiales bacterium]